jgi:hypothetical protein
MMLALLGAAQVQPVGFDLPSSAPAVYELEGYLDKAPDGEKVEQTVILGYGSKTRPYLVTKSRIQGDGDPGALYQNLGMFKPDFILVGADKALQELVDAKPGARVSGTFYFYRGMHNLEVDPKSLKVV